MTAPDDNTVKTAEAVSAIAADLIQRLLDARARHPDLDWLLLVDAAALAMRSLELMGMQADPSLSRDQAIRVIVRRFGAVLSLPDRVISASPGAHGGSDRVEVLPVWRQ